MLTALCIDTCTRGRTHAIAANIIELKISPPRRLLSRPLLDNAKQRAVRPNSNGCGYSVQYVCRGRRRAVSHYDCAARQRAKERRTQAEKVRE